MKPVIFPPYFFGKSEQNSRLVNEIELAIASLS
jgi:hypothetical protein